MTADPSLASDGGDPESWNLYSYVQGDPLNFGDDQGLARTNIIWNSFLAREKSNKWSFTFSFLPQQVTLGLTAQGLAFIVEIGRVVLDLLDQVSIVATSSVMQ